MRKKLENDPVFKAYTGASEKEIAIFREKWLKEKEKSGNPAERGDF